jgi:hypothetical protein
VALQGNGADDGWPILSRESPSLRQMPEDCTWEDFARALGDALLWINQSEPKKVEALEWLRKQGIANHTNLVQLEQRIVERMCAIEEKLDEQNRLLRTLLDRLPE